MTYDELKTQVIALGFESSIEREDIMLLSANRALREIFSERPTLGVFEGYRTRITPNLRINKIVHGNDEIKLNVFGRSYSFKTAGSGSFSVEGAGEKKDYSFDENSTRHRGFINGEATLTFSGGCFYTVFDLAVYDVLFGEGEEKIPFIGDAPTYDIRGSVSDFFSFISLPTDNKGDPIPDSELLDGHLVLPENFEGSFRVEYKRAPAKILADSSDKIDIPPECEHLLVLLVSSYVWLDDDPDKSQYYFSLYRDALLSLRITSRTRMSNTYEEVTGWI